MNAKRNKAQVKLSAAILFADTVAFFQAAAKDASAIDAAIVKLVTRAAYFVSESCKAEIDANKYGVARTARDLKLLAEAHVDTSSPILRAALAIGEGLEEFGGNAYGKACLKAQTAQDVLS